MLSRRQTLIAVPAVVLAGCKTNPDAGGLINAAMTSASALTLSDDQVRAYAAQMVAKMDKEAQIAPPSNKFAARLTALTSGAREDKGLPLNYKVYLTQDINAFACADGSIRFYSGLMEMMTDDEIRYVIGHEMGHISAAHTKRRMQTALAAGAARQAAASSGNAGAAMLAESQVGDLITQVIMSQHSQGNEREADDYAFEFMSKRKYDRRAAVTALEKLDKLAGSGGGKTNWLSTHPSPRERADRMRQKLA